MMLSRCVGSVLAALLAGTICMGDTPKARSAKEINADYAAATKQWSETMRYSPVVIFSPAAKQQMAPMATPILQKERDLVAEDMVAEPKSAPKLTFMLAKLDAQLSYFGDNAATKRLDEAAADPDKARSAAGKMGKLMADFWNAPDADTRKDLVTQAETIALADPASDVSADTLITMLDAHPEDVAVGKQINDIVTTKLKSPDAKAYTALPLKLDAPIAIDGTTPKGESWKLDKFKGKVVMIDFWATWCPPCREEIPHVAKLYADYHDKGFEIIGVSSDNDKAALLSFLKDHPEMPWPELFHAGNGWHPLTKKFGINGIPTMYVVDRNGLLRSVEGREQMETLVPQLLDEKYTPEEKPKPAVKPTGKPIGSN
jgi:thiol-disulfide isomerase/thioredoxin